MQVMDPSSEQIAPIAKKHGIILLLRFGSSVTGMLHERSDVDLAVLLERVPRSLEAHAELLHDLQQLFPSARSISPCSIVPTRSSSRGSPTPAVSSMGLPARCNG